MILFSRLAIYHSTITEVKRPKGAGVRGEGVPMNKFTLLVPCGVRALLVYLLSPLTPQRHSHASPLNGGASALRRVSLRRRLALEPPHGAGSPSPLLYQLPRT